MDPPIGMTLTTAQEFKVSKASKVFKELLGLLEPV
jgi:hypothetical protein